MAPLLDRTGRDRTVKSERSCTSRRNRHTGERSLACSSQAPQRHPKMTAYRCCLPALAGFTGFCCVGPSLQYRPASVAWICRPLREELHPAVADCGSPVRVRGTAGSPSSTTRPSLADLGVLSNAVKANFRFQIVDFRMEHA